VRGRRSQTSGRYWYWPLEMVCIPPCGPRIGSVSKLYPVLALAAGATLVRGASPLMSLQEIQPAVGAVIRHQSLLCDATFTVWPAVSVPTSLLLELARAITLVSLSRVVAAAKALPAPATRIAAAKPVASFIRI